MLVSSDYLAALLTNYQVRFNKTAGTRLLDSSILVAAHRFSSNTLSEVIPWTGDVPSVQDVTHGAVQFEDINQYTQTLTNQTWQSGWEVNREAYADDRIGLFQGKPEAMAAAAVHNQAVEVGNLLEGSTLAYDAAAYFGTTRVIGLSGAITNTMSGGGVSTTALLMTDLASAALKIAKQKSDKGKRLGWVANTVFVPVDLYQLFYQALTYNAYLATGEALAPPAELSFKAGRWTVICVPELTDVDNWFVGVVTDDIKPFVLVERDAAKLEGTTSTDSFEWRVLRKAQYTTYARYTVGWGDPRALYRITN